VPAAVAVALVLPCWSPLFPPPSWASASVEPPATARAPAAIVTMSAAGWAHAMQLLEE
jgi:hypothetical protein